MGLSLLQVTVISILATLSLSCSCFPATFEQRYCGAKTAYVGMVIAHTDNCPGTCDAIEDQGSGRITYIVRVTRTLRGKKAEDGIIYVTTADNSALCGVVLNVGQRYLFNLGDVRRDEKSCPREFFGVGLCGGAILWNRVTIEQRKFIQRDRRTGGRLCRRVPPPF